MRQAAIRPFPPALLLAATALACAGQPGALVAPGPESQPPRIAPGSEPTPPRLRLSESVRPLRQAVKLRLLPTEEGFGGTTEIDLELRAASDVIWLHAAGLRVSEASLAREGGETVALAPYASGELLGLVAGRTLGPGRGKLRLAFGGKMPARDDSGVYRQEENGDWYIFTQFEATDARRAFPCFDEPSFKIPWQLTLEVPAGDRAFANTAPVSETAAGDGPPGARKTVVFAETPPLPSYLVAFAVGPLDVVDAGPAGRAAIPLRIIVPRGKSAEAAYAVKTTGELLTRLESYFDSPYPYSKLDHIAVPQKGGAMENPGLITFASNIILGKPDERNLRLERGYASVAAHELGHIWFGDLVTMAYWDDIWLNEAFATWISSKIVDGWHPEWNGALTRVQSRSGVMGTDALRSARRIRQPIESDHDIRNAFDGITYTKGAAIISMFESFVGEERFRAGVRRYLRRHANGNATSQDFLTEVGAELGPEQGGAAGFAAAFSSFLDQPGFPVVTAALTCPKGARPRLTLTQQRYRPIGSPAESDNPTSNERWQVPVCARYPGGRSCTLLREAEGTLTLDQATTCPGWVVANAEGTGYYRVEYQGELLARLLRDGGKSLTLPERMSLLGDVGALVRNGRLPYGEALALVPGLARDDNRHILTSVAGLVSGLSDHYVPESLRPQYRRLVTTTFGPRARRLGWEPRPNEEDELRLLRPGLLALVAIEGEDEALRAQARQLADRWLTDRKSIPPELVGTVLEVAARSSDRSLWQKLLGAARQERDRRDRNRLLEAMGSFVDPKIVEENFQLALTDTFDPRESLALVFGPASDRRTRQAAYEFVKEHNDALVARLPRDFGVRLAAVGGGFCDPEHRADLEAFFKERATRATGGPRVLAQTLERMDLCIAMRAAHQTSVTGFLQKM